MDQDVIPLDFLKRALRLWWLVAAAGIFGGLVGLGVHRLRPPLYQSEAVYLAEFDLQQLEGIPFSEYDEDLALAAIQAAFLEVRPQVVKDALQAGIILDLPGFARQSSIERLHAFWMVRFRHTDPVVAQQVVSLWLVRGDAKLADYQVDKRIKPYVRFSRVSLADLPSQPLYYGTSALVMAGCLAGLAVGILLTGVWDKLRWPVKRAVHGAG